MLRFQQVCRAVAPAMAAVIFLVSLPLGAARATLVDTDRVVEQRAAEDDRARVTAFVQREDVRRQMEALGVDPDEAAARVAGLSDAEIREVAGHLDRMPAGQGAVGTLVGAALLIFFVLLITDILGLTDVFPFVRR